MARVSIIGTSHVSKESVKDIERAVDTFKPDIICVELDKGRLESLLSGAKTKLSFALIKKIGLKGTLFVLLGGSIQRTLGKKLGTKPGEEMLSAVRLGKEKKLKIALIDQPVQITLSRFSRYFRKREMFYGLWDGIRGMFGYRPFPIFDIAKVPSQKTIESIVAYMKKRFPSMYQVLLHERNIYMVEKIKNIVGNEREANILVVVGAAHRPGMLELFKK